MEVGRCPKFDWVFILMASITYVMKFKTTGKQISSTRKMYIMYWQDRCTQGAGKTDVQN